MLMETVFNVVKTVLVVLMLCNVQHVLPHLIIWMVFVSVRVVNLIIMVCVRLLSLVQQGLIIWVIILAKNVQQYQTVLLVVWLTLCRDVSHVQRLLLSINLQGLMARVHAHLNSLRLYKILVLPVVFMQQPVLMGLDFRLPVCPHLL